MTIKTFYFRLLKHPLGALYGTLPGGIAFFAAVPMFVPGMWDAALVDLVMAGILIALMLKNFIFTFRRQAEFLFQSSQRRTGKA
jgi:hypothetical protein